jgi:hypothetical protein
MSLVKKIKDFFSMILEQEIINDFIDDENPYYILATERTFMKCSVNGDYRLYALPKGFCASWSDRIIARDKDGQLLWKIEGWGRALAVHPEWSIIAAVKDKTIGLFNSDTGTIIREPLVLDVFIDALVWVDNHTLVGTDGKKIYVFNASAELIDVLDLMAEEDGFIAALAPDHKNPNGLIFLDINHKLLKKIDLKTRQLLKEVELEYCDQLFFDSQSNWIWTTVVNGTTLEEVIVLDSKNLEEHYGLIFNGKEGVRFADQSPNDLSYHSFVSIPSLSPLRQYFLVNDNSGLLWLINARTGDRRRVFKRNVLEFVYATHWLDEEYFVAMLEGGYVAKMSIRGLKTVFKVSDFDS